jgi:3'(2'), 5'-bisphosphate nucleotidase
MEQNLAIAINAALEAGAAIMEVYATDFEVETKGDDSPLTQADMKANNIINSYLEPTGIPIISEENREIPYSERKSWSSCWIVDPLDGTKEFVKRNGEFTVNIALVRDGVPVLGVIYVPVQRKLYFTSDKVHMACTIEVSNTGLSAEELIKKATPIKPLQDMQPPVKVVGSRSHLNEATRAFVNKLEKEQPVEIVSRGSSLKFCLVAEGEAHLYPRYAPTMEWDTAAGQAICEAVGVSVTEQSSGKPLRYNKENLLNPHFLVGIAHD